MATTEALARLDQIQRWLRLNDDAWEIEAIVGPKNSD